MTMFIDPDATARWAWAEIDLDAYRHNVELLCSLVAPSGVWVVVKANAYGHGAVQIAHAAFAAGVQGVCVAVTSEALELRESGVDGPILIFAEQPDSQIDDLLLSETIPTVYSEHYVDQLAQRAAILGLSGIGVHVKVDTGMHRVGVHPEQLKNVLHRIKSHSPTIFLSGIYTHFATADEPEHPAGPMQRERFADVLRELGELPSSVSVHSVNSAGALSLPTERRTFIRSGIATYGIAPGPGVAHLCHDLRPVMSLKARISHVQVVAAGEGISYGQRHTFAVPTVVATLPIGYADGVPRRLWNHGGVVLIGGRRCAIAGVITMDQMMLDCGPVGPSGAAHVAIGDEVVLIGQQGDECVRVEEWANALGTIAYEITCSIGDRVTRRYGNRPH